MLLEFKTSNFKLFKDEVVFSMLAAPKQNDLRHSLLSAKGKRVQCSSVIYGPNAAGKTNLLSAIDVLKSIVHNGNILDGGSVATLANPAVSHLNMIPNCELTTAKPVEFFVDFIEDDIRFQYVLHCDLGRFFERKYPRKIVLEKLVVDGELAFERNGNHVNIGQKVKSLFPKSDVESKSDLSPTELFLTLGYKAMISPDLAGKIFGWFDDKLDVVYQSNRFSSTPALPLKNSMYMDPTTSDAVKAFGVVSNDLGYATDENSRTELFSILTNTVGGERLAMPSREFESFGTLRFVNIFPLLVKALVHGGTLVMDEFDASIHPMALTSIVKVFHNEYINRNKAQLVFNTHNPIFLDSSLFRRDEIKLVDRDKNTGSRLYSLSDFGTSGRDGVRNGENYMRNYFIDNYGAIDYVDLAPVFEKMWKSLETGK